MQIHRRTDVEIQQATERKINRRDLIHVDPLVDALEFGEVWLTQCERRRRTQGRPFIAGESEVPTRHLFGPYALTVSITESAAAAVGEGTRNRKGLGAWYTPDELIAVLVERTVDRCWVDAVTGCGSRDLCVLDPACGDGRLLEAVKTRLASWGIGCELIGMDIDEEAVHAARARLGPSAIIIEGDALGPLKQRGGAAHRTCDLFIANPPFISQMSAHTTRGGSSRHGGGPYADVAVEFCGLALEVTSQARGRIAMILPQSLLTARDAGPIRSRMNTASTVLWDWHSDEFHFDAAVRVCAIGRELHAGEENEPPAKMPPHADSWGHLIAAARKVPRLGKIHTDGVLGDRAELNANFRDQYYGLVPAVRESDPEHDQHLPPLITTGLIDPGVCHWGNRPARFAKQTFSAPRVDLAALDAPMIAWAQRKLVPKVLVATQTRVIEAVADPMGAWLPGVPITSVIPICDPDTSDRGVEADRALWEIAAVLTSPVATIAAWWASAGSGLSSHTVRISPRLIAATPWPEGDLTQAVAHLREGQIMECGAAVMGAFGIESDHPALLWWLNSLNRTRAQVRSGGAAR